MSSTIVTYLIYVAVLVISGAAEYLKLAPSGTFLPALTLVLGHMFGTGTPLQQVNIKNGVVNNPTIPPQGK